MTETPKTLEEYMAEADALADAYAERAEAARKESEWLRKESHMLDRLSIVALILCGLASAFAIFHLGYQMGTSDAPEADPTGVPYAPRTMCQEITDQPGLWQCWDPRLADEAD